MDFEVILSIQGDVELAEMITLRFSIRIILVYICMDRPLEVHDYNVVN